MCYIVIPWVQWWVDMSVECCRIPQPHRLDGMKTIITGVQTFDFSIEADEWRRQSTKQAYIAQTSCTYLSSVFVTQAHLDNLETITTFPRQCNGINFSSQTNIFIEKLSSGLVVPVSGTAPAISKQSKIISLDISSMFTFITSACRHWDLFASCPRPHDKYSAHPQRRYSLYSVS